MKTSEIYRNEKAKFAQELKGYLLFKVDELLKMPNEEQYQFIKSLHGKTSNRINKKYRRVWFRDLPDPKYVPEDISDGLLVLNRLPSLRGKDDTIPTIAIAFPVLEIETSIENEYGFFDNPELHPDHIINYWLDQYAKEFPEKFMRKSTNL